MKETVRILGFDPGTRVAGYGILDAKVGAPAKVVTHGAMRLLRTGEGGGAPPAVERSAREGSPGPTVAERLVRLHDELSRVVEAYRPTVFAVEKVFRGKSFESVLKVGEARGVALFVAARFGLRIEEFPPAMVKKTVTGNGQAGKRQVQSMVTRLLGLEAAPEPVDVTDALALAFCYSQRLWRQQLPGEDVPRLAAALDEIRARKRRGRGGESATQRWLRRRMEAQGEDGSRGAPRKRMGDQT